MGKKDKNHENGCEKSEDTRERGVQNVFEVEYLTLLPQKSVRFLPVPLPARLTELSVTIHPLLEVDDDDIFFSFSKRFA
ncbi:hypothetical protein LOAG_10004 [Loa loa]|uniref:Uncharacterized protein n=1 Tax=Loa loa TaxID=7209 RepID=A0A1S0TRB3_LOALO|nr:hypothetical protein LOAG_10004 [Loa loa]EFO18492.1 hypothetical protein LOAG_10004 [Loa loa]